MTIGYYCYGTALNSLVNIESVVPNLEINVLPSQGGAPMPLQGGAVGRALGGKLRRDGAAVGVWMVDVMAGIADFNTLLYTMFGSYTTASKQLYVITQDDHGFWSPFLCYVDCPVMRQSADVFNWFPRKVRFDLFGGVLQSLTKATAYTVTTSDHLIYVDTSGASRTMTLPALSGVTADVPFRFVKTSASNSLILDPDSAETIDGASTKTITANRAGATIIKSGSQWVTLSDDVNAT